MECHKFFNEEAGEACEVCLNPCDLYTEEEVMAIVKEILEKMEKSISLHDISVSDRSIQG
jgi:hypothetical protein